jgi:hypothetical protein
MCCRITSTGSNLEPVASELKRRARGLSRLPDSRAALQHPTDLCPSDSHAPREQAFYLADDLGHHPNGRGLTINWRSESFPPKAPRCGVITDGFYEWSGPKNARSTTLVSPPRSWTGSDGRPLGMAKGYESCDFGARQMAVRLASQLRRKTHGFSERKHSRTTSLR